METNKKTLVERHGTWKQTFLPSDQINQSLLAYSKFYFGQKTVLQDRETNLLEKEVNMKEFHQEQSSGGELFTAWTVCSIF